ncbi:hypothetical protein OSTOST_20227 [Ostertagia ostertagi]
MGAVYGYNCSGDYDSLLFALRAMSEREKRQVTEQVQRLVGSASVEELLRYITTEAHREILLGVIADFIRQKSSS